MPPIMVILLLTRFQSTPPGWEATDVKLDTLSDVTVISIHASRVGGDWIADAMFLGKLGISIHASRVGGDYNCKAGREAPL